MTVPASGPAWRSALCAATTRLREAGIDQPAREARLLLGLAMSLPAGRLPAADAVVPASFWTLLDRRASREPMARLRGSEGFWTLDLALSADTLIPRADSEAVIEAALAIRPDRDAVGRILDLGTGTGALLLATLAEYAAAWGLGIDISEAACRQAAANAKANGLTGRAAFVCGDWAACLGAGFDMVLCNPPYIVQGDLASLMPEVARHEPMRALDGGADGLDAYRAVAARLPATLRLGGYAILEHGAGQGDEVARLLEGAGLDMIATRDDLAGVRRVAVAALSNRR